jgi:hypothetical protein
MAVRAMARSPNRLIIESIVLLLHANGRRETLRADSAPP